MTGPTWDLLVGALLILMALTGTLLKRLPVSAAALYMLIGWLLGPSVLGWVTLSLHADARLIEAICEVTVLVSLFAVGLRLQVRTKLSTWRLPALLATVAMLVTIALMTLCGLAMQWTLPSALLLAAILAPTDPVLASDVQVRHEKDDDDLRFGLTAEGGLNDGTAFPFVMLALGLLGAHALGTGGVRWWTLDVFWPVLGGMALGWTSGAAFTRLVIFLQSEKHQAMGMESFLALGLIAVTYGIALHAGVYGFLAVFVAGLSMRNVEQVVEAQAKDEVAEVAKEGATLTEDAPVVVHAKTAGAMTREVLGFAKELEKFVELGAMLLIGNLLRGNMFHWRTVLIAAALLLVARPAGVYLATWRSAWGSSQRRLGAWFGIRGVGSIYYLSFAANHGAEGSDFAAVAQAVLVTVAISVVVHGATATPLMALYQAATLRRQKR